MQEQGYLTVREGKDALGISWEAYKACFDVRRPFVRLLLTDRGAVVSMAMEPTGQQLNQAGIKALRGASLEAGAAPFSLSKSFVRVEEVSPLSADALAAAFVRIGTKPEYLEAESNAKFWGASHG